jgi:hypothetical protein
MALTTRTIPGWSSIRNVVIGYVGKRTDFQGFSEIYLDSFDTLAIVVALWLGSKAKLIDALSLTQM